ncbi:isochorismatase family protein [Nonomuraea sp. NPDC050328]|uniref:isochorismatase family protein n=1 Tax=Nonomuraea sp. NPDC050328 TaxID=3364361 RepID=UPI00378C2091
MTTLLLIDVQRNMLLPPTPAPGATEVGAAIEDLLERARAAGARVVHVRNNGGELDPDRPGTDGWELVHPPLTGEPVVDKLVPDAFTGTKLGDLLAAGDQLVVAGFQSEWCVRETGLEALRRGHEVQLVSGAHGTYDDGRPATEISAGVEQELAGAGAKIVQPGEVIFRD